MILLDKPYVSKFLKETILKYDFQVLDTGNVTEKGELKLINPEDIVEKFRNDPNSRIYANSENSINWVVRHLGFTKLPEYIHVFKNKAKFRRLLKGMYPRFFFREVGLDKLDEIDLDELPMPFIIKPAVGFLSLGVYKILTLEDWQRTKQLIRDEFNDAKALFPVEVVNTSSFLIEEVIEGEEFAFDAYFDERGEATVVGVLKHPFGSEKDVSDRLYYTSKEVIQNYLPLFADFAKKLGVYAGIKNFPMHVEVRVDKNGQVIPIEVNPLRFGGWCTSADLTYMATGMNPYQYFLTNQKPDWEKILDSMDDEIYFLAILDNSTQIQPDKISSFDYGALLEKFTNPLDLRRIDYKMYPIFGILYAKVPNLRFAEAEAILKSDLREFMKLKA